MLTLNSAVGIEIRGDQLLMAALKKGLRDISVSGSRVFDNYRQIPRNELKRLVHAVSIENTIVDLDLGGGEPFKVLIRELQRHPVRDEFLHIDFFHVAMDEKIQVEIPIVIVGTPTGVKNKGGVLDRGVLKAPRRPSR